MKIFDTGTLLVGASGIGKSETALGLISKGHTLVADDVPQFHKTNNKLMGSCPELLQDFLQVKGLGLLNIRRLYGDPALSKEQPLDLIITLESSQPIKDSEHLTGIMQQKEILGVNIPAYTIPLHSSRNIVILIEALIQNHQLKQQGWDAQEEFIRRQQHQVKLCQ